MNTSRSLISLAVLGLTLGFGAHKADAAPGKSTAYGNWQVTEMRAGAEMELPYCAMSNYFSNDVLLVMSKNADGTGSIALDFNSNRLSLDKKYPVRIIVDNRASFNFDGFPGNRQALVMELTHADDIFLPMAKYPEITVSLAKTDMTFNLGPFLGGLNDLNGCLAALTGQKVAAVDLSQVSLGADPAPVEDPAMTPMAGVAQAMWKTDAESASLESPEKLPSLQTVPVTKLEQPATPGPLAQAQGVQVMSSNAAAQGIDLSQIYATGNAPSLDAAPVTVAQVAAPRQGVPDRDELAEAAMDMPGAQGAMPAAGDDAPATMSPEPMVSAAPVAAPAEGRSPYPGEVNESIVFTTNRKKVAVPQPVVITAAEQKPMAPSMDGVAAAQEQQVQNDFAAMRAKQIGQPKTQPVAVADMGNAATSDALKETKPLDARVYQEMREKFRSPVYDRRGVNVPLAQAVDQISPGGFTVKVLSGVNAQTPVSWNGGRPWRVLLDDMLEPLGYSAIVTENQITLAAKKN